MKLVTIDKAEPGMTLAKTVLNSDFIVVLAENTQLTQAHITRLKYLNVEELYIKDSYDFSAHGVAAQALLSRSNSFAGKYTGVLRMVEGFFTNVGSDGKVSRGEMNEIVSNSVVPMIHESGAVDYLYQLKNVNSSLYNHSLRVSLLSGVLAKWCHRSKKGIEEAVLAGLLHDIGKTRISKEILGKQVENLSGDELIEYQRHTRYGYDMVIDADLSENVKYAVLQHHERNDGSGYPFNAVGKEINYYAKVIAIVDMYDNITKERTGYVRQTPFDALREITTGMFDKYDPDVCMPFIKNIRQSFLGSKVVLSDGQEGVVTYYADDYAALPLVKVADDMIIDLNVPNGLKIVEYMPVEH
jgi:putative nucleotidyltransferase with HDIG domain